MHRVKDIYKYNLGVYMFKNIGNFESSFRVNPYLTRSGDYYAPNFQRLSITQNQSIKFQAPYLWSRIPIEIKQCRSLASFKKRYKSYLINKYIEEDLQSNL